MNELTWVKELSITDAQGTTSGGLVPYLRLTKASLRSEDFQTWFRKTFFANASWFQSSFGRDKNVEKAEVVIAVSVKGLKLGEKSFSVTHGPNRCKKNNAPNTWLHWPSDLQNILSKDDFTGLPVTLTRQSDGNYRMDIQATKT